MHTYNQDLVSVVVDRCISYAPKVCSHCSRCCCCLLLYDRQRMGFRLNSARGPGLYHRCLNPFFSIASFHIKSLLTHSSRESGMMTRSSAYRSSQGTQPETHVTKPPSKGRIPGRQSGFCQHRLT